jgi:hypothetical protein
MGVFWLCIGFLTPRATSGRAPAVDGLPFLGGRSVDLA